MKKYIILFFLIFQLTSYAEQITLGLRSNNMFALSVWENDKGQLKHYLYLYNKTPKEIKILIKLKKYKGSGSEFEEVKTDKDLYKVFLAPSRVTKLDYPANFIKLNYMDFYENGKSIGLLEFNMEEPERAFVEDQYKFYCNSGVNGVKAKCWMKLESINYPNTKMVIKGNLKTNTDNLLIKILNPAEDGKSYLSKLDSLKESDPTIIKLDQSNMIHTTKLEGNFGQGKLIFVELIMEWIQEGKMIWTQPIQIPIFKD